MGCIYLRKNKFNGKCYVGQAKNVKKRNRKWKNLKTEYAGKVINKARAKYGIDAFDFEILKECEDEELNYWEMYYVKEYNSKAPNGYNMTDGGDSAYEMTEETKAKIGAANRGKKHSAEAVARSAAAHRGMKHSEETRAKIAAAHRGMKQSPETIEKRVRKLRGRKRPDVAAALRGRKQSPETIEKKAAAKSKAVQALDKVTGEVVMEFPSAVEAQRQGFSKGHISACCNGKRKSHKGLIWRFAS